MTPDIYLIWYREKGSKEDRAAGFAYTWKVAESMAQDLYSIKKKIDKSEDVITGISLLTCGSLYTLTPPKQRWQILPFLSILTSNR